MFKKGDIVKIKKASEFYGQSYDKGTIVSYDRIDKKWLDVKFYDGYENSYKGEDLEYAEISNWKKYMGMKK